MSSILALPFTAGFYFASPIIAAIERRWKWLLAYLCIKMHRKRTKPRFEAYDMDALDDPFKIGLFPPDEEVVSESPQDEAHLSQASDEILFYGVNSSSEFFMARISRINSEHADVGICIRLKNGKIYELHNAQCHQYVSKNSSKMFTGDGLRMHYIEPMRKWRIFFKGLLREVPINDRDASRMVYVKFGLQWRASSDCFDTLSDINNSDLAMALAKRKWEGYLPDLKKFHNAVNSYHEGGVIRGVLEINNTEQNEIYLFGEKIRYLGNAAVTEGFRFSFISGHINKSGRFVHISEIHVPDVVEKFKFGYVVNPEGMVKPARSIDIKEGLSWKENGLDANFHANEFKFNVKTKVSRHTPTCKICEKGEYQISVYDAELDLNSSTGKGILVEGQIWKPRERSISNNISKKIPKSIPLAVDFSEDICQMPEVTGGKGSSLGKLTEISKKYQNFIVPKGIVVTTSAYEMFMTENISNEIKKLADVLYGKTHGDIKEACQRVMNTVVDTDVPKVLQESIVTHLIKEFGDDEWDQKMFAVRSSATGEDSEEMSAAGQMETFLGVKQLKEIIVSLKKCWASQFSFISVQYKRQNGQELNTPMAVVIQEMVPCDVAGVLFTCDPVTGNPTLMNITANYGLGESVVSGSEEPDTIILEKSSDENLKIKEKMIGAKSHRIIVKDGSGPVEEDIPQDKRETCALPDELSLRLGKIAMNIEKNYRSERDIEWGILNDDFYIFQSRPVTTNNEETDYEIDHENDAPMRVENEYFSVFNVGEVMPGATSPLGVDVIINFFHYVFQTKSFRFFRPYAPKYCPKGMLSMYNHVMTYGTDIFEYMSKGNNTFVKALMIALAGRVIDNDEMLELAMERFQHKKNSFSLMKIINYFYYVFMSSRALKRLKVFYETELPWDNYKTAADLFDAIAHKCHYPMEAFLCHCLCSGKSVTGNMLLLHQLEKVKGEIDTDVHSDLSELLSTVSDVESATVPAAMESLAYQIGKEMGSDEFQKMSVEDAENWLISSTSDSSKAFRDFQKRHGHRCLREFDMRTPAWSDDTKQLVKLLQNLTRSVKEDRAEKKVKSFEEILPNLKVPLNTTRRLLFKYIYLPLARNGVQSREAGKSVLIKSLNEWRKGYKRLAKLMVSEGRIPEEDLFFFISFQEIRELLKNRSPKIISRAYHRRRRYPVLDSYIFEGLSKGVPKPVNLEHPEDTTNDENLSMTGIPISRGYIKGYLRVAFTLDEASHLKPGEILLAYSTDIGWSPYFPTLAGVITELGSMTSHGAVVSREYGLPCIVGLHGATKLFKTGDYVLLDANKGILKRLPQPETISPDS